MLLLTWAYRPQTTLPPADVMPSSLRPVSVCAREQGGLLNIPDVDLDNRSLCQNTQVGVQRARAMHGQLWFEDRLVSMVGWSYGFFLTEMMGSFAVTPRLGTLTCANL